jgi:deferrochelatase/peroxidase EfeB
LAPPRGTPTTPLQGAQREVLAAEQPTVAPRAKADLTKAQADAAKAELELEVARRAAQQNKPDTSTLRASLVRSIEGLRQAKRLSRSRFAATGFGSDILKSAGSPVIAVREALKPVTANTALNQIVELKKAGVALTPISDSDIRLLSSTIAGLDPEQPDESFQNAVDVTIDHYTGLLDKLDRVPTPEGARAALAARKAAREAGGK